MKELLRLIPPGQAVLAVLAGSVVVLTGAALLATSGALITGAAGQPSSLLVLMPLITGVRLFAISRAALRYAERMIAHDLTLRFVGRLRARLLDRLVPLAPAAMTGVRGGELLARIRADTAGRGAARTAAGARRRRAGLGPLGRSGGRAGPVRGGRRVRRRLPGPRPRAARPPDHRRRS